MARPKTTFTLGTPSIAQVDGDLVYLCCEPSLVMGGFVACLFQVRIAEERRWEQHAKWALPMFAGGRFAMKHYYTCPWCNRDLPTITEQVTREFDERSNFGERPGGHRKGMN